MTVILLINSGFIHLEAICLARDKQAHTTIKQEFVCQIIPQVRTCDIYRTISGFTGLSPQSFCLLVCKHFVSGGSLLILAGLLGP